MGGFMGDSRIKQHTEYCSSNPHSLGDRWIDVWMDE